MVRSQVVHRALKEPPLSCPSQFIVRTELEFLLFDHKLCYERYLRRDAISGSVDMDIFKAVIATVSRFPRFQVVWYGINKLILTGPSIILSTV